MKKKNVLSFLVVLTISLSSCGTLTGIRKPVALIDFPSDLVIKNQETGEVLPIVNAVIGSSTAGRNTNINYIGPAVRFKPKKSITLELTSNGISKTIEISRKNNVGMLILEGFFTFGTFAAVDIITGGNKTHNPPFIDVKALFQGKEQRGKKEMMNYIKANSH